MHTVKGSKQYKMKVVRHRPWLGYIIFVVVVVIVVAVAKSFHYAGYNQGIVEKQQLELTVKELTDELQVKTQSLITLEQQLTNAKLGATVDRQSSEDVRKEVAQLQKQIADLEADNRFYRNLMAPTENKRGLSFGAVELIDTEDPRRFNYKIVVQQLSTSHNLLSGQLDVVIAGMQEGIEANYFLSDVSPEVTFKSIKLRFKYFQTIEGSIILPEGFEASGIELVAKSTGSNAVTIKKRFGWLVEKR